MKNNPVVQSLIAKTLKELQASPRPAQHSRTWSSPTGYRYLVQWSNAVLLRYLIRLFTSSLPKSEYRRKAQVDDAARSVVRNIEEGFKRSNTSTYLEFIGFSQGSLEEVKGDIRELTEDKFLPSKPGSSLHSIGLDLGSFNKALAPVQEIKGNYRNIKEQRGKKPPESDSLFLYRPITTLYPPLKDVNADDLTYEIFMELINKTDFVLRRLVESLERKLSDDRKFYQIGQAKIKDAIRGRE